MLGAYSSILTAPFIGGFLIAGACSGNSDRIPADTTASAPASDPSGLVSDTMADTSKAIDTTAAPRASVDTPRVQSQNAAGTQAPRPKPLRPNIDPGRKAPPAETPAKPAAPAAAPSTPARTPAPSSAAQDSSLKYDAASNTVTFSLIGGPNGFQFNGYASGGATLTLPPKANVVMNFINKDGTPHSAEIIPGEGPLPTNPVDPALPRAYTNQLLQGLPQEAGDAMKFQVPESGTYRIFCGVPGHGLGGMWIWMKVDPAAKAPSFGPTKQ